MNIPDEALHATDESWSRGEHINMPPGKKVLVCTTSWQEAVAQYVQAERMHVIHPSILIHPGDGIQDDRERAVVWAGDPTDGSLALLAAVVSGIRKRGNVEKFKLRAYPTTMPGPEVMDYLSATDVVEVPANPGVIDQAMRVSKVYVAPAMQPTSWDPMAARAACHGCLVVAPCKYGYPELFSRVGALLCLHSYDNTEYALSLAATVVEALAFETDGYPSSFGMAARSVFDPKREAFSWDELSGFLGVVNGSRPAG